MKITTAETEYSKKWASENPELFTKNILKFIEQHTSDYWTFTMSATKGFFTLIAELK
jgi:hypothetical protein